MSVTQDRIKKVSIEKFQLDGHQQKDDLVTIERPLAIFILYKDSISPKQLSITMRTPGEDKALALGFLYNEGIIKDLDDVKDISTNGQDEIHIHINLVESQEDIATDRNFISSAACGVCGKSSIEDAMKVNYSPLPIDEVAVNEKIIFGLGEKLLMAQKDFDQTGGIHAVGLYDLNGNLEALSEDVGRHNALDKMIGGQLLQKKLPLNKKILLLSGRVGFELVQKSLMARIPILVAIGAPSSLCYDLAKTNNLTMIGFLKAKSFNLYTSPLKFKGNLEYQLKKTRENENET